MSSNSPKIVHLNEAVQRILAARFEGNDEVLSMAQDIAKDLATAVRPPADSASLLYLDGEEVVVTLPPKRGAAWLRDDLAKRIVAKPSFMDDVIKRLEEL